jgi:hypothetical protein
MKGFWKYLLIFIGVLVVAFIVGIVVFAPRMGGVGLYGMPFGRMPMMRQFGGFEGGFGRGGVGFGLIRIVFACLGPLFILALLGLGIYLLVRSKNKAAAPAAPVYPTTTSIPAAVPPATASTETPAPGIPPAPASACPHCGKPVDAGWVACPFCGEKLAS